MLQKNDNEFTGLNSFPLRERIFRYDLAHFRNGAQQDFRPKAMLTFDARFDFVGELWQGRFIRTKNHISALKMRLRISKLQARAERTEIVHLDLVVAADVDAPQQANENWHSGSIARGKAKVAGTMISGNNAHISVASILKDDEIRL